MRSTDQIWEVGGLTVDSSDDLRDHGVTVMRDLEASACFAAGTLLHTQGGLKPIEKIQVGDMVLSKHESGEGERAYKRVTKTFVHEDEVLVSLGYGEWDDDKGTVWGERLLVTPNHPIWVEGKGWKEAGTMRSTLKPTKLETLEGSNVRSGYAFKLYSTTTPNIAWMLKTFTNSGLGYKGSLFDVTQNKQVMDEANPGCSKSAFWGDDRGLSGAKPGKEHLYRARVYNLEVEDFHTYYVGKHGVWVHNKNLQVKLKMSG
ncbi:MAG: polymorphic toxin-type HINT domain-containing protein [Pseudomonadota bacterium]